MECTCPKYLILIDAEHLDEAIELARQECDVHSDGIDSDLKYCLYDNPQDFDLDDIKKVLAVFEGAREGPDWHWIIQLEDGNVAHLTGGCDYSGWGCVSHATSTIYNTTFDALIVIRDDMIRNDLAEQVMDGIKRRTWEERMSLNMSAEIRQF